MKEETYLYMGGARFKCLHEEGSRVFHIRVKATVRKNGTVKSRFTAEYKDEGQGWKECVAVYIETGNVSEKGQRYLSRPVCPLGGGAIIRLYDPEPTFEDVSSQARSELGGQRQ